MTFWLVRHRDAVALAATALLMSGTWAILHAARLTQPTLARAPEMTVALEELPLDAPTPPAPQPSLPQPPTLQPPTPPQPAPTAAPIEAPAPLASERSAQPVALAPPTAEATPMLMPVPAPAPAPARSAVSSANVEDGYIAELRRYLESIKRYPTGREARQSRPTGTVRVWIELERDGRLVDAGLEAGSGAMLLDHEALRTVRSGAYPKFPADAFAGAPTHRFVLSIEYRIDGQT